MEGFHESENVVNILSINSILVNIDIISGSYVNGTTKNTIYSFFPKVSPGYKIIPALGVGALSGLASSGVQKAMGSGLYLKKGGCICQVETDGRGLYLKPYKSNGLQSFGDGLYLKQGGKLYNGKGLLLDPNSPFANIPILGAIL